MQYSTSSSSSTHLLKPSMSRFRPQYEDLESEDDYLGNVLQKNQESDDDFSSLSFGALNSAQQKLREQDEETKPKKASKSSKKMNPNSKKSYKPQSDSDSGSDSDSDEGFFDKGKRSKDKNSKDKKSKNKHAPAESSSKRPVSKIREIPGLKSKKESTLYNDIRFDAAYGKADWNRIRKDYAFLDDYREKEINEMRGMLKDKKARQTMSGRDVQDTEFQIQSLQLRLDTLRNRDLANKIVGDHKREQNSKMRKGEQVNPYYLKKSEQRKMIQKAKFETMKASQREKVMERKRKRRLGREFRELEFRGPQ